eukprot:PITA_09339
MDNLRRRRGIAVAAMVVLQALLLYVTNPCMAADYTVGDNKGWEFGLDYASWASKHTFRAGDNLIFKYDASFHSVMEVDSSSYQSCNLESPLSYDHSGKTVIHLNSSDTRYFICGGTGHCKSANMKLEVTVLSGEKPSMQRPIGSGNPAPAPSTKMPIVRPTSRSPDSSSAPLIHLDSITGFVSALVLSCFAILFL